MLKVNFAGNADVEALGEAAFAVLERTGMRFQNDEMLRALRTAGAQVDEGPQVARFPRKMLADFVDGIRAETSPGGQDQATPFQVPSLPSVTGSVAQFVYDFDSQKPRPGARADLIEFAKLGSALDPNGSVGHAVLVRDVPPILEPLEAAIILAEHAKRPEPPFAWDVRQADYLAEMGQLLGFDQWYSLGAVCIVHPLCFDKNPADRYVRMMKEGHRPAGLTAMPVAGVSTPVTVEGFIAVTAAEYLGAWIAGRALNPEIPLGGSMWAGTSDMKSGHVSYSAFDAMFYAIATAQFLDQWCGVRVGVGGGEYCASKTPGLYAALEKAYKAMTIAAFTGDHPQIGEGMVDNGKVLSDVQLLLDREMGLGLRHYAGEVSAGEDLISLSTILDVGFGEKTSYLTRDHTALNFRDSLWLPNLMARTGWTGHEDEQVVLQRLRDEARSLIGAAPKPEGRGDALAGMREIVEKARAELVE
jgi:trimethylamine:corrinoid methyltransferase-like protein